VTCAFNYVNERFLSYSIPAGATITGINHVWNQQLILVEFVAPFEDSISNATRPTNYNYSFIQSSDTAVTTAFASGGQATVTTNTLQLAVIPNAFLIYVLPPTTGLYSQTSISPSIPDFFFNIANINIQFGERQGLLGQCSQYQLWSLSKKNGSNVDYRRWSGAPINSSQGFRGNYGGGVLVLNVAQDLGLPKSTCSGMVYPSNFTANITINNQSPFDYNTGAGSGGAPIVRVVALTDGWITTAGSGNVDIHVGAITKEMLYAASEMPYLEEEVVRQKSRNAGYSGGRYSWKDFKHDLSGFANYIKPVSKPIIEALTHKAVDKISGSGKMKRGTIRGMLSGYY